MKRRSKAFIIDTSLVASGKTVIIKTIESVINRWLIDNPDAIIQHVTSTQITDSTMMLCFIYEEQE